MDNVRIGIVESNLRITQCGFLWAINGQKGVLCRKPGIMLELLLMATQNLHLTPIFVAPATGKYGVLTKNGWDGLVGLMQTNQTDLSVPLLTPTMERSRVIQFPIISMFHVRLTFLLNAPKFLPINEIWMPFHVEVWLSLLFSFLLTTTVLYFSAQFQLGKLRFDTFSSYAFGLLLEKKSKVLWRTDVLRIILLFWSLSAKFVMVSFAVIYVRNCTPG